MVRAMNPIVLDELILVPNETPKLSSTLGICG